MSIAVAVRSTPLVFIGTVRRVEADRRPPPRQLPDGRIVFAGGSMSETVFISVDRVFRGSLDPIVTFHQDGGDTCSLGLRAGETWLIYAWREAGRMHVSKCNRTRRIELAADDLSFLEGHAENGGEPRVVSPLQHE